MKTSTHFPRLSLKNAVHAAALMALCGVGAASSLAAPSAAAPGSHSAQTSLAGLDLSTPAGVLAAQERLHQTARRLCSQVSDSNDLSHQSNFVKCVDSSLTAALPKLQEIARNAQSTRAVAKN